MKDAFMLIVNIDNVDYGTDKLSDIEVVGIPTAELQGLTVLLVY